MSVLSGCRRTSCSFRRGLPQTLSPRPTATSGLERTRRWFATALSSVETAPSQPNSYAEKSIEYWSSSPNVKGFLRDLASQHNLNSVEDWKKLEPNWVIKAGGKRLLDSRANGLFDLVKIMFPNEDVRPWEVGSVKRDFWKDLKNQHSYMDWLGRKLGYSKREDWYRTSFVDIVRNRGNGLIMIYGNSPMALITATFTDHVFHPWFFTYVPHGYFDIRENRQKYITWLMAKLQIKDARQLRHDHFHQNGGSGLLSKYRSSVENVVLSLEKASEEETLVANSKRRTGRFKLFWADERNQREFLDGIALKYRYPPDFTAWYKITARFIEAEGGRGLIARYQNRVFDMLRTVYPEHVWLPWKFVNSPRSISGDPEIMQLAVNFVEEACTVETPSDWHRVSMVALNDLGMGHLFAQNGGIISVLRRFKPEVDWRETDFETGATRSQQAS